MLKAELKKAFTDLAEVPDSNGELVLAIHRLAPPQTVNHFLNLFLTLGGAPEVLKRRYLRSGTDFDFEGLSRYQPGTLGHAWYHHIKDNGLYPDLLGHPLLSFYEKDSDLYVVTCRSLEIHDLLHVVSEHGVDAYGEWGVASFTSSQRYNLTGLTWWPLLLTRLAFVVPDQTLPLLDMLTDNYRRGSQAENMLSANWEEMFDWPLSKVKQTLRIAEPAPRDAELIARTNGPYPPETSINPAVKERFWQLVEDTALDVTALAKEIPALVGLYDKTLLTAYQTEMFRHKKTAQALTEKVTGTSGEPGLEFARQISDRLLRDGSPEEDKIGRQAFQLAQLADPFSANLLAVLVMRGILLDPEKLPARLKAISEGWWQGRYNNLNYLFAYA